MVIYNQTFNKNIHSSKIFNFFQVDIVLEQIKVVGGIEDIVVVIKLIQQVASKATLEKPHRKQKAAILISDLFLYGKIGVERATTPRLCSWCSALFFTKSNLVLSKKKNSWFIQ